MNERIKELAAQAGFRPYYDIGTGKVDADGQVVTLPNWSDTDPWVLKYQKFAELIVRECIAECWYDATPKQISDNIKMKFGVE